MEYKKVVKNFTKWVDEQIDFKKIIGGVGGNIAEILDGPLFGLAIKYGFEKLPEDYKDEAAAIMQSVIDGDYDAVADETIEALVLNIKTPLGDAKELIILGGLWDIVSKLIKENKS